MDLYSVDRGNRDFKRAANVHMNAAKRLYEEFHRINPERLGFLIDPRKLTKRQGRQLTSLSKSCWEQIAKDLARCHRDVERRVQCVPSPWHAWAILTSLTFRLSLTKANNLNLGVPAQHHVLVYRGQANAGLPPIPSLYRRDTNRDLERKALEAFSFLFEQDFLWSSFDVHPPRGTAKAAAQHYGINTNLLDITADPAVAIYFASLSTTRKRGDTAAVFVLDLTRVIESGCRLIVPPPVVERLYLQRGAFLEIPEVDIQRIQDAMVARLHFPFDPSFRVFADGKPLNLLNSDQWFDNAIEWAKQWAASDRSLPSVKTEIDELLLRTFTELGYPSIYKKYNDPALVLAHWADNFEEMIYWYGTRFDEHFNEYLLGGIRDEIARSNPSVVELMVGLYDALAMGHDLEQKKRLRDMWQEALRYSRNEPGGTNLPKAISLKSRG